jgi:aminoglycoside 6'-N-acetyltransferase
MPRDRHAAYGIRAATRKDLPLLSGWLRLPHLREWWGDPEESLAEMEEVMDSVSVEALIVELQSKPVAYLQCYDPHMEDDHPYQDQPTGTLGLDISIGPEEMLGKGHGPAILRQFAAELFEEGAPRVIIDPDPMNARAIRAYEKVGFVACDTRTSKYGPALMMALDAPEEI